MLERQLPQQLIRCFRWTQMKALHLCYVSKAVLGTGIGTTIITTPRQSGGPFGPQPTI